MTIVVRNGLLIDGTGADPTAATVSITADRFTEVGAPGAPLARSDDVIDADGLTLLPGLIDLHTHMGVIDLTGSGRPSPALLAAQLFENAELCLLSGHTTAREVSGADGGLRQVIDAGVIPGPRLFPSGPMISQSGGHGDHGSQWLDGHHGNTVIPGLIHTSVIVDGVDEMRRAARLAFKAGATQLKVCISGGVVSFTDRLEDTQFSVEELRAAVDEARARDTYVTAHAHNVRAIENGLAAGLECFEHGTFLDEATVEKMAASGAALVPTLSIPYLMASEREVWGIPEDIAARLNGIEEAMTRSLKLAFDAGVLIGSGSDHLGPQQNRRGLEIARKAQALGPMAAIVSATSASARILRREDLGVVAAGKTADLIAVRGDPLADPAVFDEPGNVVLVIKDGVVVKDTR